MAVYSSASGYFTLPLRASERCGGSYYHDIQVFCPAFGVTAEFSAGAFDGPADTSREKWATVPAHHRRRIIRFGRRLSKKIMDGGRPIGY